MKRILTDSAQVKRIKARANRIMIKRLANGEISFYNYNEAEHTRFVKTRREMKKYINKRLREKKSLSI